MPQTWQVLSGHVVVLVAAGTSNQCCPWAEWAFLGHKPSPMAFQRIWQYIQVASAAQEPPPPSSIFTLDWCSLHGWTPAALVLSMSALWLERPMVEVGRIVVHFIDFKCRGTVTKYAEGYGDEIQPEVHRRCLISIRICHTCELMDYLLANTDLDRLVSHTGDKQVFCGQGKSLKSLLANMQRFSPFKKTLQNHQNDEQQTCILTTIPLFTAPLWTYNSKLLHQ